MNLYKKVTLFCLPYFMVACTTMTPSPTSQSPKREPEKIVQTPKIDQAMKANIVIHSLLDRAKQQQQAGDFLSAEGSLERAIRIAPRFPESYFRLAQLRYAQGHYQQASSLAGKALSLGADPALAELAHKLIDKAHAALN